MTDQDYIRKAVELADGYVRELFRSHVEAQQWHLDALAAQLVTQMDELFLYNVHIKPTGTFIDHEGTGERIADCCLAGDRTMNTIKAIVDSKVIE